ncbi:DUF4157 domain-containing protein [Ideonella sp. DXS29W]|uniref:DUF4157 domain-containing protein n=1 Tax=Ideonella lacteola TaxID=2984193 RepID=A0ABU9BV48_9BURK
MKDRNASRRFDTTPTTALRPANVQRSAGSDAQSLPPLVKDTLNSPGSPLDAATRADMEPRFGRDFSAVRVHTDGHAAASARDLDALAFTAGQDVVFAAGHYAPQTSRGRKLLAHELAHVAQPQAAGASVSQPGDASEREADSAAEAIAAGAKVPAIRTPGAALQRQPSGEEGLDFKPMPPLTGSQGLLDNASPFLAAAVGSTTLDGFDTGKSALKPDHLKQLASTAANIRTLLDQYPLSTITVTGHADTVDAEPKNVAIGEARAAAVKQALIDLGLSEAIITTDSKGEGPPQAVKTKDETPNAKNRRVEVRFHPKKSSLPPLLSHPPSLKPPGASGRQDEFSPPEKPPINLFPPRIPDIFDNGPRPPFRPPQPDYFKPIPPVPKGSEPSSPLDVIGKKIIDPVIDAVGGFLPKEARDKIKDAARSGVKSGIAKGARAAAEAQGIKDPAALDAIEKATEAAIQEKGQPRP